MEQDIQVLVARIVTVLGMAYGDAMREQDGDDYARGTGRSRILKRLHIMNESEEKRGLCKIALLSMAREDEKFARTGLINLMTALSCALDEDRIKKGKDIYMNEMYYV